LPAASSWLVHSLVQLPEFKGRIVRGLRAESSRRELRPSADAPLGEAEEAKGVQSCGVTST